MSNITSGQKIIKNILVDVPNSPGIYKMFANNQILYVGKAKDLKKRLTSYTRDNLNSRISHLISCITHVEFIVTKSEEEALILELNLIKQRQPKYNILLKDDKSFNYLKIDTSHKFPQVKKQRSFSPVESDMYGPFTSTAVLNNMLSLIQKIFRLRNCTDYYFASRKRPCVQYEVKRCSAPCVNFISEKNYNNTVKQAKMFLNGKTLALQDELVKEMQKYSDNCEYEKAIIIRDRIQSINAAQIKSATTNSNIMNFDVMGFSQIKQQICVKIFRYRGGQNYGDKTYLRNLEDDLITKESFLTTLISQVYQIGEIPELLIIPFKIENFEEQIIKILSQIRQKKVVIKLLHDAENIFLRNANQNALIHLQNKMKEKSIHSMQLESVAELFELAKIDSIELYDNSHIMGSHAVGAMVVVNADGFAKNKYRIYSMQNIHNDTHGGDDYMMLRNMLSKRIKNMKEDDKPSLMIIDGGKGHLNAANQVLSQINDPPKLVAMSKGRDRNKGNEVFHQIGKEPFTLCNTTGVMQYLQNIRDEVHKFAINTYRKKHNKSLYTSSLDDVPGIGNKKKQILLNYLGSFQNVKNANFDSLSKIPNIGPKLAKIIFNFFNKE